MGRPPKLTPRQLNRRKVESQHLRLAKLARVGAVVRIGGEHAVTAAGSNCTDRVTQATRKAWPPSDAPVKHPTGKAWSYVRLQTEPTMIRWLRVGRERNPADIRKGHSKWEEFEIAHPHWYSKPTSELCSSPGDASNWYRIVHIGAVVGNRR
jgi:hypothetical protein